MLEMMYMKLVFAVVYKADENKVFVSSSYHGPVDAQIIVASSNHALNSRTLYSVKARILVP